MPRSHHGHQNQPRDVAGRFTATRTTKTKTTHTRTVTEHVTIHHNGIFGNIPGPIPWAPGWDHGTALTRHDYLAHRTGQVERCLDFLWVWAASTAPGTPPPARLIGDATVILRAGPGATPSELEFGRSV